ncbi:MAG: N,N-dimethylformamidase beta subunit family domain-containing protein, partial [Bdellovibrionales bacterium]
IVVKDPTKQAPIVVVFPYNTVAAYNYMDGTSLYEGPDHKLATRSRQVSFARPTADKDRFSQGFLDWHAALPPDQQSLFRYISDQDMDDYSEIANAKVVVIVGHSEYWTRAARNNFDKFVDSGGHAAVLSGNTMWWQVRYSNDGSALICYKSADEDQITDRSLVTVEWDRPELNYSLIKSIGVTWTNGGFGMKAKDEGWDGYRIINSHSPLLARTGLRTGQVLHFPTHEYDGAPIRGFDSAGRPLLDEVALGFYRTELIGYDFAQLSGVKTVPTFIAFQKTESSGIVVNTASTNWCSFEGLGFPGVAGERIRKITENIIFGLLNGKPIFSP